MSHVRPPFDPLQFLYDLRLDIRLGKDGRIVLDGMRKIPIIAFFSGVTIQDKKDWLVGKAQYGLYSENGIPIFLLDLGKTWSLDAYIQPKKIVLLQPRSSFKPRTVRHSGKRFN